MEQLGRDEKAHALYVEIIDSYYGAWVRAMKWEGPNV